jgi:NADH-quinone oxidoreductase subunit B
VLDGLMLLQDKIARVERRPGVVKPRLDPPQRVSELVQLRRRADDPSELAARLREGQGK